MKGKMFFKLEEPTFQGRIYTKENFIEKMNEALLVKENKIPLGLMDYHKSEFQLQKQLGFIYNYEVLSDNSVSLNYMLTEPIRLKDVYIIPTSIGIVDERTNVVDIHSIELFSLVNNENINIHEEDFKDYYEELQLILEF